MNDKNNKDKPFEWNKYPYHISPAICAGDIRMVYLPVKVIFEWSDKIVSDHDHPESDWVEYTSGYIMKVFPQTIVYNGEPSTLINQATGMPDSESEKK